MYSHIYLIYIYSAKIYNLLDALTLIIITGNDFDITIDLVNDIKDALLYFKGILAALKFNLVPDYVCCTELLLKDQCLK